MTFDPKNEYGIIHPIDEDDAVLIAEAREFLPKGTKFLIVKKELRKESFNPICQKAWYYGPYENRMPGVLVSREVA